METRIALIGIIVADRNESGKLNEILHEYGEYIVGRMGSLIRINMLMSSASSSMRPRMSSVPCQGNWVCFPM